MSSRPSVEGLDTVSAAFDLNTEAATTVTQGNSVDEATVEATAGSAGNHTNAGGGQDVDRRVVHETEGGTQLLDAPAEEYVECNNRGQDHRDELETTSVGRTDAAASGQSDSVSPREGEYDGLIGVQHASDDVLTMGNPNMIKNSSLAETASENNDSKKGDTCHSMKIDARVSEEISGTKTAGKSLGDRKHHVNQVNDAGHEKTECLIVQAPRRIKKPNTKYTVTGNDDTETSQLVGYPLPQNDRRGFRVSDLIWGKVKNHPWWPGQIVDPSFASELALKHQRRKQSYLVAYFGDKTFAWCDDSQLKPFSTIFSQMEKQSSSEGFRDAVSSSLFEVSRRVQMGMICSCVPETLYSELKVHKFDSSGVRKGAAAATVNKPECLHMFEPHTFLQYVTTLARFPTNGTYHFDITVACAQWMAYNRFEYPLVFAGKGPLESKDESSPSKNPVEHSASVSAVDDTLLCNLTSLKMKSRSGRKRKHVQRDGKEESSSQHDGIKSENNLENRTGLRKRKNSLVISPVDFGSSKTKKRRLDPFEPIDVKSPSPTPQKSFIIGECVSRVASKLTSFSQNLKSTGDPLRKNKDKVDDEQDGPFSLDTSNALSDEQHLVDKSFPGEDMSMSILLSRFASIASDPLGSHDFIPVAVSFFSDVRLLQVSSSNVPKEFWELEKHDSGSAVGIVTQEGMKRKRGRPKLIYSKDNNYVTEEVLKTGSEIKRKRGRPSKSSLATNNINTTEDIKPLQTMKRKRGRPPKCSYGQDLKSHVEDGSKHDMPTDDKKSCEEVDNKKAQMEIVPMCDSSELLMPDYLQDSYWTDVAVKNSSQKRRRGRRRREESLAPSIDSKPDGVPSVSRSLTAISNKHTHHVSIVSQDTSNGLACERRITYFGEKTVEELNPTALVLNFSAISFLPSEIDLMRIFSRYGPLKESDTELQKHTRRAIVVFKRRADAEVAFKEVPFSRLGSSLIDFCLKSFPFLSESTQKVTVSGAKVTILADSEHLNYSGNNNELFHEGSIQLEPTNAIFGEPSSSSMIDNLKQNLPSSMDICKPEIPTVEKIEPPCNKSTMLSSPAEGPVNDSGSLQNISSGVCQTPMGMFLGDIQDQHRDGVKSTMGSSELNGDEMPSSDGSLVISCDSGQCPHQSTSAPASTFQIDSSVCNVESPVEESFMKVNTVQIPGGKNGFKQHDERSCSILHLTTAETATEVCSSEKVALSGHMHGMDDRGAENKRPDCGLGSESLFDEKHEATLNTRVTVSMEGSTPTDVCHMGDQGLKTVVSDVGSSFFDSGDTKLTSVDIGIKDIERNAPLDHSTISDGKHAASDLTFEALGTTEEPASAQLVKSEVQGQTVSKVLAFDGDMKVPSPMNGERNLHDSGKDIARINDIHHLRACNELSSSNGKEQLVQNSRSPYTLGVTKESSVLNSKSDITGLRVEPASVTDRKLDDIPGCQ